MQKPTSKKPRKQRKWLANAPLNKRRKMMGARLSDDLREKYKRKSLPVRKGDTVKVMRGEFKGTSGEVTSLNLKSYKIYVSGITIKKANARDVERPINPSNVMITGLFLEDKERREMLGRNIKTE